MLDSNTELNDFTSEGRSRSDRVLEVREQSMFDDLITEIAKKQTRFSKALLSYQEVPYLRRMQSYREDLDYDLCAS